MWSPYPDHNLTLWALPPPPPGDSGSKLTHLDSRQTWAEKQKRRHQWWQLSRDFKLAADTNHKGKGLDYTEKDESAKSRGKTTEILATHRLNFGNQSIRRLSIPRSSIQYLTGLVELRMPQNKLTSLPRSLFALQQLEILNLENNLLDENGVPDHLWRDMAHLRVLFLAGNMFTRLPPSLGKAPRLFYLDVSDNHLLGHLPVELLASSSIGTLAANRCSNEIMNRLDESSRSENMCAGTPGCLPLVSALRVDKDVGYSLVPSLAGSCIRRIHNAIEPFANEERGADSNQEEAAAEAPAIVDPHELSVGRGLFEACQEIRNSPSEYIVSDILLKALDSADELYACSVCSSPVFYPSFGIVKAVDHWTLPFSWQCCSAACRDKAIETAIHKSLNYI
ncbi:hypothetical protein GGI12_002506 [Dipsacomyces acuminosporus]|nr:hypothetical protein GGI12_002506 [Dipsacomyces acuminosporus]